MVKRMEASLGFQEKPRGRDPQGMNSRKSGPKASAELRGFASEPQVMIRRNTCYGRLRIEGCVLVPDRSRWGRFESQGGKAGFGIATVFEFHPSNLPDTRDDV